MGQLERLHIKKCQRQAWVTSILISDVAFLAHTSLVFSYLRGAGIERLTTSSADRILRMFRLIRYCFLEHG
jgi:hypothetical protein